MNCYGTFILNNSVSNGKYGKLLLYYYDMNGRLCLAFFFRRNASNNWLGWHGWEWICLVDYVHMGNMDSFSFSFSVLYIYLSMNKKELYIYMV